MPARRDLNKILIVGSGPIVIGQACEFDYSGTQAVKALKEEGYQVILVNPNPATVMTTPGLADSIYVDPLRVPYLESIIAHERPDGLLATMGGQTALNLALELDAAGVLERYGVEVLGAGIKAIGMAEDRGRFKEVIASIGLQSPRSALVSSVSEARDFLTATDPPIIIRPSYTLGGKGGSIARTREEFASLVEWALAESPTHTALIEESLIGWKEFELEVMRDRADNAVVVCSIENVDPMGVHTGDSITVAPIQTLSDREYQQMRDASIEILRAIGVDCGGSNVQFAVDPGSGRMLVIEMNPRVSRSSALASKATGFPIARCSARLAVGYTLDEVINDITGKTVSCFEPSLDYVAVKVPRFEIEKFPAGYAELGTQMKSVGESLAIGRTFLEALNKAIRACEFGFDGLQALEGLSPDRIDRMIDERHPRRIFAIYTRLLREGPRALADIEVRSGYNRWFLSQFLQQASWVHRAVADGLSDELLWTAKRMGLSDAAAAAAFRCSAGEVTQRREQLDLHACYHFVDTCSGEFEARTPYFYSTWGEIDEGRAVGPGGVIILGSGPNRIGQGLEFDTCCTLSSLAYRELGRTTIMINSNPETVSTDFNVSDRLYIEPLSAEDVIGIMRKEQVSDVVVQLGGQTPLNMAQQLERAGATIVGTPVARIRDAEDRGLFARVIAAAGLRQAENRMAANRDDAQRLAAEIGFPVLCRPSFVLGGRSMSIAYTPEELDAYLGSSGIRISAAEPVLVDQFLEDAFEYDLDALADGSHVYIAGIMQHIEAAGIHSGDSACVFPSYKGDAAGLQQMKRAAAVIAREFGVLGFLNIQFAVRDGEVYVIEVNPRASRTVPFISKVTGVNLVDAAVRLWSGRNLREQGLINDHQTGISNVGEGRSVVGWAVKEAMFSFDRFRDVDPLLGPEMRSTGEAIGIGESFGEAFAKASSAVGSDLPSAGRVFVSVHDSDKPTVLPLVRQLQELGFGVSATRGTAEFLFANGVFAEVILKVHEGHPNIVDHLAAGRIDLVINTPLGRFTQRDDGYIRIETMRRHVPYTTTTSAAEAALEGIRYVQTGAAVPRRLPDNW
ncbi:MAG: carbamoyl-phosphate synthase large subunit [Spirochaetaceae bacterium]|nr:MAG: carbamoyl-phosphate synthase large subunit [Spirochaetaceae bacterium]